MVKVIIIMEMIFGVRIWAGKIDTNALSIDVTKCDVVYKILEKIRFFQ